MFIDISDSTDKLIDLALCNSNNSLSGKKLFTVSQNTFYTMCISNICFHNLSDLLNVLA